MSDLPLAAPPEVATVGELLGVIAPADPGLSLEATDLLEKSIGGAEVNVALGLARLDHRVSWVGAVGDDPFGRTGLRLLRTEGVDASAAVVSGSAPTGVYFKEVTASSGVRNYPYRSVAAATRLTYGDIDVDLVLSARVLHLTGVTACISDAGHELVSRLVREAPRAGVHVSFDVNVRRRLLVGRDPRTLLVPLARLADTLLMSREEALLLFDVDIDDTSALVALLASLRAQTVVIHDATGARAVTRDGTHRVDASRVDVVDPTGAGDSFAAGYLSGWLDGLPMSGRLDRAVRCAALAVASRFDSPAGLAANVVGRPPHCVPATHALHDR